MALGTRDSDLVPEYNRGLGAYVTGSNIIKVHIAKITSERALSNLEDNGMIALTMGNVQTYETYQAKGKAISFLDATEEEQKKVEEYMRNIDEVLVQLFGMASRAVYTFPHNPTVVIEIEVQELFDQTPKIGAGERLQS